MQKARLEVERVCMDIIDKIFQKINRIQRERERERERESDSFQ